MKDCYTYSDISVVIPAKNEGRSIESVLTDLRRFCPEIEIFVVDDGSVDNTSDIVRVSGATLLSHPNSLGNGAAIKTGARAVIRPLICFMDGDGQHQAEDIAKLLNRLNQGFDMVVGARSFSAQANFLRGMGNRFYNWFATLMVGQKVEDLTSGMRLVKADKFVEFLYMLPNKFSYPTTITMAFFRTGYSVGYEQINVKKRLGNSHLNVWKDGVRFLLIIFKIGTLYSPLKIFLPVAAVQFLTGVGYYLYVYFDSGRFTNMAALLITSSITVFLIGLVSEQITSLFYKKQ